MIIWQAPVSFYNIDSLINMLMIWICISSFVTLICPTSLQAEYWHWDLYDSMRSGRQRSQPSGGAEPSLGLGCSMWPGQLLQELVCSDMGNVPLKISLLCLCLPLRHIPLCFPYRLQLFFCCVLFFLAVVCFCWELSSKSISVRWRRSLY